MQYFLSHLRELESEAIFVMREVVSQFEKPALLFSGGKDSIVLTHLARKAFYPARIPFPLIHIDTGHNFPETITYRDALVERLGVQLIVGSVQDSIDKGRVKEETGLNASRNALQTVTLLDTLEQFKIDAAMGGAVGAGAAARVSDAACALAGGPGLVGGGDRAVARRRRIGGVDFLGGLQPGGRAGHRGGLLLRLEQHHGAA